MGLYQNYLARRMWLGLFLFVCVLSLVNCGKSDGGGGGGGTTAETPNTCGVGYSYANQQLGCLSVNGCSATDNQVWYQNSCVRVADINNPQSQWYYMNYQNGGTYNGQYNGTYNGQYNGYYNPYNNYGTYMYGNPFYGGSGNPYNYGGSFYYYRRF